MRSPLFPMTVLLGLCLSASAAALVGCSDTRGSQLIVNSHIDYNKAVSTVLREELLLNVVRRRYMEAPQFLNVASINTNITTTSTVGVGGSGSDVGDRNIFGVDIDGRVTFSDSPTITITPRQGEDIASQLHGPLSVTAVADLITVGYPIDDVFNALVEGVNNVRGPDLRYDSFRPGSDEWREFLDLLKILQNRGDLIVDRFRWNDPYNDYPYPAERISPELWVTTLSIGANRWKSYDGGESFYFTTHEMAPAIWLSEAGRRSPEGRRLMEILNIQPDVQKRIWILEPARVASGSDLEGRADARRPTLKLRMRSLYNVLNFYSFLVHVPEEDELEGRATDLSSFREAVSRAEIEDFRQEAAIRFSRDQPENAFQSVEYRGMWFYIDDRDQGAKQGFNWLYDLWQLSVKAPSSQSEPLTTIQVNN